MITHKNIIVGLCCMWVLVVAGCSRQQSDWQKTREANTADAYEQFLKKYPTGEFSAQAQARVKQLYEERDWQRARDADTAEAYQAFLKLYPDGKWTEEARIRVENFTLAQAPSGGPAGLPGGAEPGAVVGLPGGAEPGAPAASPSPAAARVPPRTAAQPTVSGEPAPAGAKAKSSPRSPGAAGGPYAVQLGAFKSGAGAAEQRWTHLKNQYPTVLAGLSCKVLPKKTSAGSLYRLQAIGLTEQHARDVCSALKARSQPCLVVPPTPG
jgi:cell division septation protein DedD